MESFMSRVPFVVEIPATSTPYGVGSGGCRGVGGSWCVTGDPIGLFHDHIRVVPEAVVVCEMSVMWSFDVVVLRMTEGRL
jgi:hypothetical protein